MSEVIWMLLLQALLIGLNAVFASAEIAVLSVSETKLAKLSEQGNKKATRLMKLIRQPAKFLATIQVAITLSGFLGSAFAADNFSDGLVSWLLSLGVPVSEKTLDTIAVVLITLILSYFTLIFGELVPKRIAMRKSEKLALGISGLIGGISVIFSPIVWLLTASTNGVLRLIGIDPEAADEEISEEEIRMMVDAGSQSGAIDAAEQELIHNVFEFDDLTAGEIATHRTEVDTLWLKDTPEQWAESIRQTRHGLYPVCDGSKDDITGVLRVADYYRLEKKSRENILKHAVKPAYFVPERIKADVLFRNMRAGGHAMAVVVDEYGGMSGVITMKDLIEQLIGEFPAEGEEADAEMPRIIRGEGDCWKIRGNVEMHKLEKALGVQIPGEEFDTFSGFVFGALSRIPEDGTCDIPVEFPLFNVKIQRIGEHQIQEAELMLKK